MPAMMETWMSKTTFALAFALSLAGLAANAQTVVSDTDGNGVYSIEELTAAYPDMTADLFGQIDVDGSGAVDADELQAARENGLIAN
jgi:EF hand